MIWVRLFKTATTLLSHLISLIKAKPKAFRSYYLLFPLEFRNDHIPDQLSLITSLLSCSEVVQILFYLIVDLLLVCVFENHLLHSLSVLMARRPLLEGSVCAVTSFTKPQWRDVLFQVHNFFYLTLEVFIVFVFFGLRNGPTMRENPRTTLFLEPRGLSTF